MLVTIVQFFVYVCLTEYVIEGDVNFSCICRLLTNSLENFQHTDLLLLSEEGKSCFYIFFIQAILPKSLQISAKTNL